MELDLENSNLTPATGENQRFCYQITGVGEDTSAYADLSHLVLGVCDQLTRAMFASVSVTIDGEEQDVVWGENVEIRTADAPDPPTGCAGLKLDFGLDKVGGVMEVCFELYQPLAVGASPVCLYGGGATANGLYICGPVCAAADECPAVGYQSMSVCVPVTVTPYARAGIPTTYCCGAPEATEGPAVCPGTPGGACTFTLTQRVCVAVPVSFGANAVTGEASVNCLGVTTDDSCDDCD